MMLKITAEFPNPYLSYDPKIPLAGLGQFWLGMSENAQLNI